MLQCAICFGIKERRKKPGLINGYNRPIGRCSTWGNVRRIALSPFKTEYPPVYIKSREEDGFNSDSNELKRNLESGSAIVRAEIH